MTDLWGAMIALYGGRWTSQFGEPVDISGQWRETLRGVTREQIESALEALRTSGRPWPPTAPEFRAMCVDGTRSLSPEVAYAQLLEYQRGEITAQQLDRLIYHAINRNMDYYQFKLLPMDKAMDAFKFAYRAAIEQAATGREIVTAPPPAPALPMGEPRVVSPEMVEQERMKIFAMLDTRPEEPRQKTAEELADDERLRQIAESR